MTAHEQTYRLLNIGEVIDDGDEVFERDERWHLAKSIGSVCGAYLLPHRRAITQPLAADTAPLAALAMRDAAAKLADEVKNAFIADAENARSEWGDTYGAALSEASSASAGSIASNIRAIHIPDEAALTAAAMTLPKVKALLEAATPYTVPINNADFARQLREYDALIAAVAALTPAS